MKLCQSRSHNEQNQSPPRDRCPTCNQLDYSEKAAKLKEKRKLRSKARNDRKWNRRTLQQKNASRKKEDETNWTKCAIVGHSFVSHLETQNMVRST